MAEDVTGDSMRRRFIEIRGGTGAGKSTLVRALMDALADLRVSEDLRLTTGKFSMRQIAIPGSYKMTTGGLENRYTQREILAMLERAATCAEVVVLEGGLLSKSTGRVYEWCVQNHDYFAVHLAIPVDHAQRNLAQRRRKILRAAQLRAIARDHELVASAMFRIYADKRKLGAYTCPSYYEALDKVKSLIRRPWQ